jgi:hypothetical protein
MRLSVTTEGYIELSEVYNPVIFESKAQTLIVCMRDEGFEIQLKDKNSGSSYIYATTGNNQIYNYGEN